MEQSSKDNTPVIGMKRDYDAFLSGTSGTKPAGVLSFDQEKETETMLKDVEMIRAKSYISQQESHVSSLEVSPKIAPERECEHRSVKQDTEDAKADGASKESDSEAKSSLEASETQTQAEGSNVSTQESQLSTEGPVFLPLVDCHVPVEQVLPQLTSSMWMRGLGHLVRAKSIRTVGDLSKLTEYDVNMLPFKTPKVKTVRAVLANFQQTLNSKAPGNGAAGTAKGEETAAEHTPASETASADDKDDKSALETSLPLDADDNQNTSTNLLDEIKQLEFSKKFMADVDKLVEQSDSEAFSQMPLNNLLQLQQRISTLTNNMVLAFSDKWPSSQSSQESPESPE